MALATTLVVLACSVAPARGDVLGAAAVTVNDVAGEVAAPVAAAPAQAVAETTAPARQGVAAARSMTAAAAALTAAPVCAAVPSTSRPTVVNRAGVRGREHARPQTC